MPTMVIPVPVGGIAVLFTLAFGGKIKKINNKKTALLMSAVFFIFTSILI